MFLKNVRLTLEWRCQLVCILGTSNSAKKRPKVVLSYFEVACFSELTLLVELVEVQLAKFRHERQPSTLESVIKAPDQAGFNENGL